MEQGLAGKVAIVTGGASGIGRATVLALAKAGAAVAVAVRRRKDADDVVAQVEEGGGRAIAMVLELTATHRIPRFVERVGAELGRIDILVNCAAVSGATGSGLPPSLIDTDEATWDLVYGVNVKAPMLLMQHVSRHLIKEGRGGRIVNVSSSSAFRSRLSPAAYGSSKAALVQLTRSAAAELGCHDINVNAVAPGVTATPMTLRAFGGPSALQRAVEIGPGENLLHRVAQPEDVAETILFLCLPASRQITGQTIHTSAGAVV